MDAAICTIVLEVSSAADDWEWAALVSWAELSDIWRAVEAAWSDEILILPMMSRRFPARNEIPSAMLPISSWRNGGIVTVRLPAVNSLMASFMVLTGFLT